MRVSTSDPDARKMKMGDSGYRLAFNVQFVTGTKSRVIFGADVFNTIDPGTSPIMMQKVHSTLEKLKMPKPETWVADSAYSGKSDVDKAHEQFPNCKYFAPAKAKKGDDPKKVQKNDSPAVVAWRKTIDTEEMNEAYKNRCSTAEFSNAQTKNQGMVEFLVRGFEKVRAMANLHAIAHNVCRYLDLISKKNTNCVC